MRLSLLSLALLGALPLPCPAQTDAAAKADAKAAVAPKFESAMVPITDVAGLPRVLLIGDSISIGYTLQVRALLKGQANVHRVLENGADTATGLKKLEGWLGKDKWDVIRFNWGLHDLKHMKDNKLDVLKGPQVASVETYEKNLRELVAKLQATGAKLIWCSTTPVPEASGGRVEHDEAAYNAAAARVMAEAKIPTDDLAALVAPHAAEWQLPHNVHFNEKGYAALAEKVAEAIRGELKE